MIEVLSHGQMIAGISGYPKWGSNDDCLELSFWYLQDGYLKRYKALCPHGLQELNRCTIPTYAHIDGAVQWLESVAIPSATPASWDNSILWFNPSYRGHLAYYPANTGNIQPWPDDPNELVEPILRSSTMEEIIGLRPRLPGLIHGQSPLAEAIRQQMRDYLSSEVVQGYLRAKAEDMAQFWARQFLLETDAERFRVAMVEDILQGFSNGWVRFYDTDYAPQDALKELLEKNNLEGLAKSLPWKTWQHFDFSDAPPIV
jgi:hypothetical protein